MFAKEREFPRYWYRDWIKGFDGESILKPKERRVPARNSGTLIAFPH